MVKCHKVKYQLIRHICKPEITPGICLPYRSNVRPEDRTNKMKHLVFPFFFLFLRELINYFKGDINLHIIIILGYQYVYFPKCHGYLFVTMTKQVLRHNVSQIFFKVLTTSAIYFRGSK